MKIHKRNSLLALAFVLMLPAMVWGQPILPNSPFTRTFLRATNAEQARNILGVSTNNTVYNTDQFDTTGPIAAKSGIRLTNPVILAPTITNLDARGAVTKLGNTNECIVTNGQVGIRKIPSPGYSLDVSGSALITGTIYAGAFNFGAGGLSKSGNNYLLGSDGLPGLSVNTNGSAKLGPTNEMIVSNGVVSIRKAATGGGSYSLEVGGNTYASGASYAGNFTTLGSYYGDGSKLTNLNTYGISTNTVLGIMGDSMSVWGTWPDRFTNMPPWNRFCGVTNLAGGGNTTQNMTNDYWLLPALTNGQRGLLTLEYGQNDQYWDGDMIASWDRLQEVTTWAHSNGWEVMVFTVTPRGDGYGNLRLHWYNENIRRATNFDYLCDWATRFSQPTNANFNADKLHLSADGYNIAAGMVDQALRAGPRRGGTSYPATPGEWASLINPGLDQFRYPSNTIAAANAAGLPGQRYWDSDYIYQCVATNTWKRVAISTW